MIITSSEIFSVKLPEIMVPLDSKADGDYYGSSILDSSFIL